MDKIMARVGIDGMQKYHIAPFLLNSCMTSSIPA